MTKFRLHVRRHVPAEFKEAAKAAFPVETYALLLGHRFENRAVVEDLWFPPDVEEWCGTGYVLVRPQWKAAAAR